MKKVFTILLLIPSILLFSQDGFETNVAGTLHYSHMKKSSFGAKNINGGFGYGLSLKESYFFNEHIGIQTGADLMNLKIDFDAFVGKIPTLHSYTILFKHEVNFLEMYIPLNLVLRTQKINSFCYSISGGLGYRNIIFARATIFNDAEIYTGKADLRIRDNPFFKSQNLNLNVEYLYKNKNSITASFNFYKTKYLYGGLEKEFFTDGTLSNKVYSISLGYNF